jgi:hypothetical protein
MPRSRVSKLFPAPQLHGGYQSIEPLRLEPVRHPRRIPGARVASRMRSIPVQPAVKVGIEKASFLGRPRQDDLPAQHLVEPTGSGARGPNHKELWKAPVRPRGTAARRDALQPRPLTRIFCRPLGRVHVEYDSVRSLNCGERRFPDVADAGQCVRGWMETDERGLFKKANVGPAATGFGENDPASPNWRPGSLSGE